METAETGRAPSRPGRAQARLVYLCQIDLGKPSGYRTKIVSQCMTFRSQGYETFTLSPVGGTVQVRRVIDGRLEKAEVEPSERQSREPHSGVVGTLMKHACLVLCLLTVDRALRPRVYYIRRLIPLSPLLPIILCFLRMRGRKVFFEYPTYPWSDETLRVSKLLYLYERPLHLLLDLFVDYFVVVPAGPVRVSRRYIEIANGVDVDAYRQRDPQDHYGVRLIGVAFLQKWHAFDRVIEGIARYRWRVTETSGVPVSFDIIGDGPERKALEAGTREAGLSELVRFHGVCDPEKTDELFDRADVAIGSLGYHRIGATRGTVLKAREYCARGIPLVLSYTDEGLADAAAFVLKVAGSDEPVDVAAVVRWYEGLRGKSEASPEAIRGYARTRLSWGRALRSVCDRLLRIAEPSGSAAADAPQLPEGGGAMR